MIQQTKDKQLKVILKIINSLPDPKLIPLITLVEETNKSFPPIKRILANRIGLLLGRQHKYITFHRAVGSPHHTEYCFIKRSEVHKWKKK